MVERKIKKICDGDVVICTNKQSNELQRWESLCALAQGRHFCDAGGGNPWGQERHSGHKKEFMWLLASVFIQILAKL